MSTATVTAKTIPTEPGIYKDITFADYTLVDAVNASKLEPFMRTPAHAREAMLHPGEGTEAMVMGHAFHTFLLEPERFAADYAVPPKVDRRTTAGKQTWAAWEAENPGRTLLKAEEAESYERMARSIMAHDFARELQPGDVRRPAGRGGVATAHLHEIRGVETGGAHAYEELPGSRDRLGVVAYLDVAVH